MAYLCAMAPHNLWRGHLGGVHFVWKCRPMPARSSFPPLWAPSAKRGVLRENEAVAVDPVWVLWVELHELVEEDVSDWGHTHGRTRVTRVGLEGRIDLLNMSSACARVSIASIQDIGSIVGAMRYRCP